jgi:hypothetical protein
MIRLVRQRFSEVLARKRIGIKLNWVDPLDKQTQEKLTLAVKQEVKLQTSGVSI